MLSERQIEIAHPAISIRDHDPPGHLAVRLVDSVWSRHDCMAGRDSLDRRDIRPMALGFLEEGEQLGSCAKDHAP